MENKNEIIDDWCYEFSDKGTMKKVEERLDYINFENNDFIDFMNHKPFIDDLINLFTENDVQIIRGSDHQYSLYINQVAHAPSLTPGGALFYGTRQYKSLKSMNIILKNVTESNLEV